jgi:hypothetical protein
VPIVRERATGSRRVADGPDEACANRRASSLPGGGDDSSDEDEDRRDFMQQPLGEKSAAPLARASSITRPDNSSSHRHVPLPLRRPAATPHGGLDGSVLAASSPKCTSDSDTQLSSESEGDFDHLLPRVQLDKTPSSAALVRSTSPPSHGSVKRKRGVDDSDLLCDESIARTLCFRCSCGSDCLSHFTRAQVFVEREATRNAMEAMNLRHHVLQHARNAATLCPVKEKQIYRFHVAERGVCEEAWALVHGVKGSLLRNAKTWHNNGLAEPEKRKRKSRSQRNSCSHQEVKLPMRSEAANTCIEWQKEYIRRHGCCMPDSQYTYIDDVPFTKLHEDYAAETAGTCTPVGARHFSRLWWAHFRKSVRKRKRKPFGTCRRCMGYKKSISELVRDAQALRRMKEEYYAHLEEQKDERLSYYGRRMKGISGSALSIIMDGMDQNKLILPHAKEHLKDADGLVETKVTGVLVHGHFFDTYVVEPQVAHDSNLSITCLHRTLMKLFRKGRVPSVLYLQVDGGSENKNQWMMSYLSLLVELKLFRKIKMCFLPVGHTHEDIDQVNPQTAHFPKLTAPRVL